MDLIAHFRAARNLVSVPAGAVLFKEGDPGSTMYVLIEGLAEISVGGEMLESAAPGALLGEMALISPSPRSATVIARRNCRFVSVDARQFDLLVRESPEFARHVMTVMADRLRRTNEKLKETLEQLAFRSRRLR